MKKGVKNKRRNGAQNVLIFFCTKHWLLVQKIFYTSAFSGEIFPYNPTLPSTISTWELLRKKRLITSIQHGCSLWERDIFTKWIWNSITIIRFGIVDFYFENTEFEKECIDNAPFKKMKFFCEATLKRHGAERRRVIGMLPWSATVTKIIKWFCRGRQCLLKKKSLYGDCILGNEKSNIQRVVSEEWDENIRKMWYTYLGINSVRMLWWIAKIYIIQV